MKDHTIAMYLTATARDSAVVLDGQDISNQLRGVGIISTVDGGTTVTLYPARGHRVNLITTLPEAQIVVERE
jgi:hypothetical protein